VKYFLFLTLLLGAILSGAQKNASPAPSPHGMDLTTLYDQYFEEYYFKFNPTQGTSAGFHQYDGQLEDYSKSAIDKQIIVLKKFQKEFSGG
jgi:hypothetical protein